VVAAWAVLAEAAGVWPWRCRGDAAVGFGQLRGCERDECDGSVRVNLASPSDPAPCPFFLRRLVDRERVRVS